MYGSDKPVYPAARGIRRRPAGTPRAVAERLAARSPRSFWQDVSAPITDPANVFSFKHMSATTASCWSRLAGCPALRDDAPSRWAVTQFGHPICTHPLWVERAVNWLVGNEYVGYPGGADLVQLDRSTQVAEVEPGAIWPRTLPEHFPKAVEIAAELPAWFRL
jgi:hypothetical protein